jgi:predicted DNA-binding transcriptional regulator YafY
MPKHRPPLERMLRIHQSLQSGKFPNATTLAQELEVSTKSIQRDLDFMRDRLELPIEYHPKSFGYHYTGEVTSFPTMHITEGELVALVIAEKALEQYRGTQFEKPLLSAIRKIEQSLPDTISLNLADIEQTIEPGDLRRPRQSHRATSSVGTHVSQGWQPGRGGAVD